MPRYRFIGDPLDGFDGPDRFTWMGVEFSRDEWAEVSDPFMVAKLDGHSHYERDDDGEADEPADGDAPVSAPKKRGRPKKAS